MKVCNEESLVFAIVMFYIYEFFGSIIGIAAEFKMKNIACGKLKRCVGFGWHYRFVYYGVIFDLFRL